MAIKKSIDINGNGITCSVWRIDNVPIFRDRAIIAVAGWLDEAHFNGDTKKCNHVQAKQYIVEDKPAVPEQLDDNGEMEIPYQPARPDFTDYFGDVALLQAGASPLKNGYEYLLSLPEFEGGIEYPPITK